MLGLKRVKVSIILALAERGGRATTQQLLDILQLPPNTLSRNLRELENEAAVTADVAASERTGRTTTWTLDRNRVLHEIDQLRAAVSD